MPRSWGHEVRRLTEDEIARAEKQDERGAEIFKREGYAYTTICRMPKCRERITCEIRYSYVTGRAGRTSWAAKNVCTGHAEKFAAKHGVEITDAPAQEHASQQAIRAAFGTGSASPVAVKEA
jgi:predicted secreted protein